MRRDRAGAPRLREAVDAYRANQQDKLNQQALKLLAQLTDNTDAAAAFDRLKLKGLTEAIPILHSCVIAEQLARTFTERITTERRALASMEGLDKAVEELSKFVSERAKQPVVWRGVKEEDGLILIRPEPDDFRAMHYGLALIATLIEGRRHTASTRNLWLGTTRNTRKKKDRENVGIGSLLRRCSASLGSPTRGKLPKWRE